MKTSEKGKAFIKLKEGCRLRAYNDGGGVWTIGYGHIKGVRPGDVCTQEQAELWFDEEIEEYEGYVNYLVKVPLTQGQFDALVSFCYNLGPDIDEDVFAEGLGDSTLLRKLNSGDYAGAAKEFPKWSCGPDGKVWMGLLFRREAEKAMFLGEEKE